MNHRLTIIAAVASALASTALYPLIAGGKWFWGGLGAILAVAATGTATRHRALRGAPAIVCLLAALAVLLLYLNLVFASGYSFLGVLPNGSSLAHLGNLIRQALHETQNDAPPVPARPGIVMLATAGVGAIGAVTDLIAVRLRRCALAGLPLLALFSVPIASGADKSALGTGLVFCLGMTGYLTLLGADGRERLRLWGRLVTPWQPAADAPDDEQAAPNTRTLAASGRRIGLAAVVLALFAPLLIPGLHAHKLVHGHRLGTGPGSSGNEGTALPNPMVQMTHDLAESKPRVVLTYQTSVPVSEHPPYLQTYVLDNLTASTGTLKLTSKGIRVGKKGSLPAVPGLSQPGRWRRIQTAISISPGVRAPSSDASFLPMPYPARVLNTVGDWKVDPDTLMTYSGQSLSGLVYTVTSDDVDPSPQLLKSSPAPPRSAADLSLPGSFNSLRGFAEQITRGAATPYAKAEALQNWFTSAGRFRYSLNVARASSATALRNFLLHSRAGYCQQFSFAMAVLARLLGIPSRIAVGFTAGTSLGHGKWQVMTSDAHSWTELYFTGVGWLPWEPTPPGTGIGQGTAVAPAYTIPPGTIVGGNGGGSSSTTNPGGTPGLNANQTGHLRGPLGDKLSFDNVIGSAPVSRPHAAAPGSSGPPVLLLLIAALLATGLVGPRITRSVTSRQRWLRARDDAGRAHAAWLELLDSLADHGIGHGPGETPRALVRRVTDRWKLDEQAREALLRIAAAEERACYAPAPGPPDGLPADVTTVRRAIAASVTRVTRWQARLWPASALARARDALSHVLDVFGWAEVAVTRARGRLPRTHPAGPS